MRVRCEPGPSATPADIVTRLTVSGIDFCSLADANVPFSPPAQRTVLVRRMLGPDVLKVTLPLDAMELDVRERPRSSFHLSRRQGQRTLFAYVITGNNRL